MPAANANPAGESYWNSEAGRNWVSLQTLISDVFTFVTVATLEEAAPKRGECIIDVGCGTGDTLLDLARAAGPSGTVLGVDVSDPMLEFAKHRVAASELKNVSFALADATSYPFLPNWADLVFSRFGVMFFDEPVKAFANIRRGMKRGGRLVFVCFRAMSESSWYKVPIEAARPHLPPQPVVSPDTPGMFSFANEVRLRKFLTEAGFEQIQTKPTNLAMRGKDMEQTMTFMTQVGPVTRMLASGSEEQRRKASEAVRAALAAGIGSDGLGLGSGLWLVSALAP